MTRMYYLHRPTAELIIQLGTQDGTGPDFILA